MEIEISRECKLKPDDLVVFATQEFLKLKGSDYGYIYGLDSHGQLVFYMAFILKKRFCFCLAEFQTSVICLDDSQKSEKAKFLNEANVMRKN